MHHFKFKNSKCSEHGITLVEFIIAIGILGIICLGIMRFYSSASKVGVRISNNSDRIGLQQMLMEKVDCVKTIPNPILNCPNPIYLDLKDGVGNIIVSKNSAAPASVIGGWAIRAECNSTNDEIVVKAAHMVPGGKITDTAATRFLKDPITSALLNWTNPNASIFPPGSGLCANRFVRGAGVFCPAPGVKVAPGVDCATGYTVVGKDSKSGQSCCVLEYQKFCASFAVLTGSNSACTQAHSYLGVGWNGFCEGAGSAVCNSRGYNTGRLTVACPGGIYLTCTNRRYPP